MRSAVRALRGARWCVACSCCGAACAVGSGARRVRRRDRRCAALRSPTPPRARRDPAGDRQVATASSGRPRQRIADGELLLRSKDYARAAGVLNQVVEKYPNHPTAYPDALFLLGETLLPRRSSISRRAASIDRSSTSGAERGFSSYQAESARAARRRRAPHSGLRHARRRLRHDDQLPSRGGGGRARLRARQGPLRQEGLRRREERARRRRAAERVLPPGAVPARPDRHEGGGAARPAPRTRARRRRLAHALRGRHRSVPAGHAAPADTAEHRHVIDLSWLAIGRLLYETDQWIAGRRGLQPRRSQLARVQHDALRARLGVRAARRRRSRAARARSALPIADPNSPNIADGTLLRADLMLRTGQFERRSALPGGARAVRSDAREGRAFLGSTNDPAVYYDKLSQGAARRRLEPTAVAPAPRGSVGARGRGRSRGLRRDRRRERVPRADQAEQRVRRALNAVLNAPNRVRAFPELKAGEEKALSLLNTMAHSRASARPGARLRRGPARSSARCSGSRRTARAPEAARSSCRSPTRDFQQRENEAQKQWNSVSQKLQQLTPAGRQLQATSTV